jgi:hypothetical protein
MRIFLRFNSKEVALAQAIRVGLYRREPDAKIFLPPVSLGSGLWVPKLANEIAAGIGDPLRRARAARIAVQSLP